MQNYIYIISTYSIKAYKLTTSGNAVLYQRKKFIWEFMYFLYVGLF